MLQGVSVLPGWFRRGFRELQMALLEFSKDFKTLQVLRGTRFQVQTKEWFLGVPGSFQRISRDVSGELQRVFKELVGVEAPGV